jgi:hypothetical protein
MLNRVDPESRGGLMGVKDKWAAARERNRQEQQAEEARWRRVTKREQLARLGVPAAEATGKAEEDLDAMIVAAKELQAELYEAFVRAGTVKKFTALGVQVLAGDDKVYTLGTHDQYAKTNDSRVLGLLAGSEAKVTDSTSTFSPGKALLMPIATAALARKETADAMVVFANGKVHTTALDGSQAVRDARRQVLQFNVLVGSSAAPASEAGSDPAAKLRKLEELRDAGLLTQDEYESKRAEVIASLLEPGGPRSDNHIG